MVRVSPLVLFLILEKKPSAFIIEYDVSCGLVIYKLYYVEVCSLGAQFFKRFIVKEFSNAFPVCVEMIIWLSFLSLSPWSITLIDNVDLSNPGISAMSPCDQWVWGLKMQLCIQLVGISLRSFASMLIRNIDL